MAMRLAWKVGPSQVLGSGWTMLGPTLLRPYSMYQARALRASGVVKSMREKSSLKRLPPAAAVRLARRLGVETPL